MGEGDQVMAATRPASPRETPALEAFDWRDDPMGHMVAVPDVRARFMRFEPGRAPGG
jgi:hypothetical protein